MTSNHDKFGNYSELVITVFNYRADLVSCMGLHIPGWGFHYITI